MLNYISKSIQSLNNSKFFAGLIMIMLNIGSKYITLELSESQKEYLKNSMARQFLIFSIAWMGTRDIIYSILLTASFIVLADHLFNEKSPYCILPKSLVKIEKAVDLNNDNNITEKEIQNAISILEKAKERTKRENQMRFVNELRNSSEALFY